MVKCNADIVSFYKNLLVFLSAHQSESEHRMFDAFNRFPVQDKHSILATYSTELTHHAYSLIRQQHSAAAKVTLEGTTVQSHEGMLTLDSTSCQCQFFKTTALPCRHIFKYRQDTGMPVYEATLVPERWRRSYWLAALNIPLRLSVINLVKDYVDVAYVKSQVSSALLEWTCSVCTNAFAADDNSVSCDRCLLWVHFSCANLKRAPAKKEWYCKLCRQAAP